MVLTESTNMPVASSAPDFTLPDTRNGEPVTLGNIEGPVLIVFMCNHCPYVVHIVDPLVALAAELNQRGVTTIAISSNDVVSHPADGPAKMAALAAAKGFDFPYCFDETQQVARSYNAVCTPDIFLFDSQHKLFYHGQFDDTRPGRDVAHGGDLRTAALQMLEGGLAPTDTSPSVGCSIKWKAG